MENSSNGALVSPPRYVRFGPFQVDQHRQEVFLNGSRLKLQGKVYQVLLALLEKPGEIVSREEIRQRLWPTETHVNYDANVNTTVNKLRQALGDSSDKPMYIETIPRRGYCLLVQPEFSDIPQTTSGMPLAKPSDTSGLERVQSGSFLPLSSPTAWVTIGAIALVLAGMLLGAGIAAFWISHFVKHSR